MNDRNYKKKYEFQNKVISKKSEEIESLKLQIEKLNLEIKEKDEIINSVSSLKDELIKEVDEIKVYKEEYRILVKELRKMKEVINSTYYKGRWNLIRLLIK